MSSRLGLPWCCAHSPLLRAVTLETLTPSNVAGLAKSGSPAGEGRSTLAPVGYEIVHAAGGDHRRAGALGMRGPRPRASAFRVRIRAYLNRSPHRAFASDLFEDRFMRTAIVLQLKLVEMKAASRAAFSWTAGEWSSGGTAEIVVSGLTPRSPWHEGVLPGDPRSEMSRGS